MTVAKIELPPKLVPVFTGPARYRGAFGGRGSGKTRSFALMAAVRGYMWGKEGREGQILCVRQFQNSLDESSLEEIKAAIRSVDWLEDYYEIGEKFIRSKDGRIKFTFSGLERNINSIKSKARILLCWADEAEPIIEEAWRKLIPTIREEGSELWITWNPESKRSATHIRFIEDEPDNAKIIRLNWKDNPYFPEVLEITRQEDLAKRPHLYDHIWEGDFLTAFEGAYYAQHLREADKQGRITRVTFDPLLPVNLYADIGGTGRLSDSFVFWPAQFIGASEIRVRDYYEAQGQEAASHLNWARSMGYGPDRARIVLPHDGVQHDKVHAVTYESFFRQAGYTVDVIPNQGRGAAKMRIEAARRAFPGIWFDEESTVGGREALAFYHEKLDEARGIGLGPEHDWSSHGSDAFGMMAIAHEGHTTPRKRRPRKRATGWAA